MSPRTDESQQYLDWLAGEEATSGDQLLRFHAKLDRSYKHHFAPVEAAPRSTKGGDVLFCRRCDREYSLAGLADRETRKCDCGAWIQVGPQNKRAASDDWQPIATIDRDSAPSFDLYDPVHAGEYGASWDGYWDDGEGCWKAAVWCNSCTTWHATRIEPTYWRHRPPAPAQEAR